MKQVDGEGVGGIFWFVCGGGAPKQRPAGGGGGGDHRQPIINVEAHGKDHWRG